MQKRDWKNVANFQSYAKKIVPPFWIDPPFLTNLAKYFRVLCFWQKYKLIAKILKNFQFMPLWILAAILEIKRHLESDKKLKSAQVRSSNQKPNAKMFKTHRVMVEKPVFPPFSKSLKFWKPEKLTLNWSLYFRDLGPKKYFAANYKKNL
jgi:hypothetical protein